MSTANIIGLCMYPALAIAWYCYTRHLKTRGLTLQQLFWAQLKGFAVLVGFLLLASYLARL